MGQEVKISDPVWKIIALAENNDIAPLLSSVLFGNVKAQHIVQAAQDVLSKFRGQVPESMATLQDITGIGPKLSQILNIVNKRDTYKGEGTSG